MEQPNREPRTLPTYRVPKAYKQMDMVSESIKLSAFEHINRIFRIFAALSVLRRSTGEALCFMEVDGAVAIEELRRKDWFSSILERP